MANLETLRRLNEVFQEVFGDPEIAIFDAMTAKDVAGWDSLNHINLVVHVEKAFQIRFTTKEIMIFRNVGDFAAAIDRKLAARP